MHDRHTADDGSANRLSRRGLLGAGLAATAPAAWAAETTTQPVKADDVERFPLGKSGLKVSRLGFGASFPEYGPRLIEFAYQNGIRYFDNSIRYVGGKAEGELGNWLERSGKRDDVVVVTKTKVMEPDQFYAQAEAALKRLRIDTIDLFFVHGIDDPEIPLDRDGKWRKAKDRLLKDGKVRATGFSCHADMPLRTACLENAVKGGWIDALMVACDPGLIRRETAFNQALDLCHKAGVGLVAMKTSRGLGKALDQPQQALEHFKKLNLTPHQAMQAGIWSDGRFACAVVEMANRRLIEENAAGARAFRKPFDEEQKKTLFDGIERLSRATCPGCTGACRQAAGVEADFCSVARFVAYHEEDGKRDEARQLFQKLPPAARDWRGGDLSAASQACPAKLDFTRICAAAERHFA